MLSNNQIEILARAEVEGILNRIDSIETDIPAKDKKLGFDGELLIYMNSKASKKSNIGRLRVQVKGRSISKLPPESRHKITIDTDDAKIYYTEGRVLYFQVYFSKPNAENHKTYYRFLSPQDLKSRFLDSQKKGRKTIGSFSFFELNSASFNGLHKYFQECIQISKTQMSITHEPITNEFQTFDPSNATALRMYGLAERGKYYEVFFNGNPNHPDDISILTNDRNLESIDSIESWNTTAYLLGNIQIPAYLKEFQNMRIRFSQIRNLIFSNTEGVIYSKEQTTYKHCDGSMRMKINPCVEITITQEKFKFSLLEKGTLGERITGIKILHSLYNNDLLVDGHRFIYEHNSTGKTPIELSKAFQTTERIAKICEDIPILGKFLSLPYNQRISEQLYKAYLLVAEPQKNPGENAGFKLLVIEDISIILFYYVENSNKETVWRYINPFTPLGIALHMRVEEKTQEKYIPTSIFCYFTVFEWIKSMNFDYEYALSSIKSLNLEEAAIQDILNKTTLELLTAFDTSGNVSFLNLANETIRLIQAHAKEDSLIHFNLLQTQFRFNEELTSNDQAWLRNIISTSSSKAMICGSYILLREPDHAKEIFKSLSKDEKEMIEGYPIMNLLNKKPDGD